jgi:hypothetical protein
LILDVPYNFHWIEGREAARAAQAYLGFLGQFVRAHGIRAVLNLRGSNPNHSWWRYETRVCAAGGIVHRDAKLNSRQLPTRGMLVDVLDAFDSLPQPLLIKCSGGQDRTSLAAALYILHRHGWLEFARAEKQFSLWPYLHRPRSSQRWLQLFLPFARERSSERTLRSWLGQAYSAQAFRDWLEERGEHQAFAGLYGVREGVKNA